MDFLWILIAFICGMAIKQLGLPPLIGYLLAGFGLHFYDVEPHQSLDLLADMGITLLLFTVGLKLNITDMLKREIWATATSFALVWSIIFTGIALFLATVGLTYFTDLSLQTAALVGFALSFSSTVCVVKLFEQAGELKTRHGRIAVGVLVMQDIFAVIFLVVAEQKIPSIWALALFGLLFIRPLIYKLMFKAGHGELMPLMGFFLAFGGYELFKAVGIKGDLGALIIGIMLASHVKASELAKSLLNFKDIFLIGFFLSIGFSALPTVEMLSIALILALILPLKMLLFSLIFYQSRLRVRTSFLASLGLTNYSEFGLIVTAIAVQQGWLSNEWLVILALTVSISFIFSSIAYRKAHSIYTRIKSNIAHMQKAVPLPNDVLHQPENANILVMGMGRVGKGAYTALCNFVDDKIYGIDADHHRVEKLAKKGLSVVVGDGEDIDFWEQLDHSKLKLILIALPKLDDQLTIYKQLKAANYQGKVAAIARFGDEREILLRAGIDKVFNFYTEAGTGFAEESLRLIE